MTETDSPTTSLITPEMLEAVGLELDRSVSFPVSLSDIRRWALAVYYPEEPPREYWDEASPEAQALGGIVAPDDFNPFAWMTAEPAGVRPLYDADSPTTEERFGIRVVPTQFMLNGGTEITYGARMRPGDVIVATNALSGYTERDGRLGRMLFTATTSTWVNQRDDMVKTVTNTVIRY